MQAVLYCAGLGDVIRVIYQTGAYKFISETTTPVKVLSASHNPFALEIFRHHRNAKNFVLHELGHKYEEFLVSGLRGGDINRALCEFAGVEPGDLVSGRPAEGYVPTFDAPDDIDSNGHIVFQPFAGSLMSRTFSEELTAKVVNVLRRLPCQVYLVTRSFTRKGTSGKVIHAEEDARQFEGGNIKVLEHLSVPGTLNLIKSSSAYVGSWSSLQQAAWFANKPVAVIYPPNWCDVVNRTGYAFGLDREDCFHTDWDVLDLGKLEQWFTRWCVTPQLPPVAP